MKFVRTVSNGRLLATIAGLLIAAAAGTAIAVAAAGQGPVAPAKPLANAVHDALAAPSVSGISADITFTNNLIGASNFTGGSTDPILQGATGRLWISSSHQMRLELQSANGDAQIVVNQHSFWVSDPALHTVYKGTLPAAQTGAKPALAGTSGILTVAQIQTDINKLMQHVVVSGARPGDVAGQAAYTVHVSPQHDGGLLGSAQLAWDAIRGVPLRVAIYARNNPTPVLELKATNISYGPVARSDFAVTPPAGSKVVTVATASASSAKAAAEPKSAHARHTSVSGVAAVSGALPFKLVAPDALVGLPRHAVKLLNWGGKPAALVTYGQNLGGIAVIEQTASSSSAAKSQTQNQSGPGQSGLSLPTISVNGATGQELATALGTVVRFTRGGVAYTVLGSVPPIAAEKAANAL